MSDNYFNLKAVYKCTADRAVTSVFIILHSTLQQHYLTLFGVPKTFLKFK